MVQWGSVTEINFRVIAVQGKVAAALLLRVQKKDCQRLCRYYHEIFSCSFLV